jgi:hypothetical protein
MKVIIKDTKEEGTVKNILKKVWAKRLGLVVSGIVLAIIVLNPFAKAKMIDNLSAKNEELTIDYDNLDEDYNILKKNYDTLLEDTAGWRELTEEQQKATLDKAEEDRRKAEVLAKEEAERKAAEEKAKQEAAAKANQEAETSQPLTEAQVKQIIDDYTGKGELVNFSFTGGQIKATINLAPSEFLAEDMAVNRYSQLSDELLNHEGWEILTISYTNIGTISMNRIEKETNEFGDYFPTMEIEERLK